MNILAKIKEYPYFSLFSAICIGLCITFGSWQIKRLFWKENLISKIEKSHEMPAKKLDIKGFKQDEMLFRKVKLEGFYIPLDFFIMGKYLSDERDSKEMGYHVITPVFTPGNYFVFVNRGWVKDKTPITKTWRKADITAIVRSADGSPPWYMPSNEPERDIWFWIDTKEMGKKVAQLLSKDSDMIDSALIHLGSKVMVRDILLQEIDSESKNPRNISAEIKLYNNHLSYIITWYVLALLIFIMWRVFVNKRSN